MRLRTWVSALALTCIAGLASAQAWPGVRPIRLIVGYPPGGGIDFAARTVQAPLQEALRQQIVVEYKPGAGGMLAAGELTRAAPDGYTLLLANTGPFAIAPYLQPKMPYDPLRQFSYVAQISQGSYIAVTRADHPAKDLGEWVAWALSTPVVFAGAWPFHKAAWVNARHAYSNFCEIFMSESQQTESRPASKNAVKLCAGKTADVRNAWEILRSEAMRVVDEEPTLKHLMDDIILSRETAASALGARLARRLSREDMPRAAMEPLLTGVFEEHPHIVHSAIRDLLATRRPLDDLADYKIPRHRILPGVLAEEEG